MPRKTHTEPSNAHPKQPRPASGSATAALCGAMIALAVCASGALAQSALGDFRPWLTSVFGGVGTDPSDPNNFTILVDDDGDILTPPVPYNLGAQAPDLAFATNYQLSPSREVLYVLDDDTSNISPDRVWFADLDGAGGVSVVHGPFSLQGQTGQVRVAQGPYYYESIGGLRTAVLILENQPAGELYAQLFDLNTPGLSGQARVNLEQGLGFGWFAPSGTHLVIKNGLSDTDTQFVDYTLINVCGTGGDFGINSDIRVSGSLIPPDPVFTVTRVGGGTIDVVGQIAGQPTAIFSGTLPDCTGTVTPEYGACCIDLGAGSIICVDGVTQIECSQGTFTANALCQDVCEVPTLEVTGIATQAVNPGGTITYTFTVDNPTSAAIDTIPVFANAPAGTVITSYTAGGIATPTSVNWTIPSLPAGQSQNFIMAVEAPCQPGTVLLEGVAYGAQLGFNLFTGTDLTTTVLAPAAVDLTVASAPTGSVPAIQGDVVVHTITMTNTGATDADTINLGCIHPGFGNSLDAIIDNAGGTIIQDACAPGSISWEGTVPAGQTRTLIFSTRIDCVSQSFPGGPLGSLLNRGVAINLRSAAPCDAILDQETPTHIDTVPPVSAALSYAELTPNTLRFNTVNHPPYFTNRTIGLGRLGEEAEVVLTITNTNGPDLADASVDYALGDTFDPPTDTPTNPFIGTPPAGVTFDDANETVRYMGPLLTGETIEIRLRLVMASAAHPSDTVAVASAPGCALPPATQRNGEIYAVPPSPGVSHAYSVTGYDNYRHDDPTNTGVDAVIPDFYIEILTGIAVGTDRSLYISDVLYNYVLNPDTLYFNVFDGVAQPQDTDPASGGTIQSTTRTIWRYLPDGTRVLVYDDQAGDFDIIRAVSTNDGMIHVLAIDTATGQAVIASIDPASGTLPLDASAVTDPVSVPTVTYPFESAFGPVLNRRWTGLADDGTDLFALVSTVYDGTPANPGIFEMRALARIDLADRSVHIDEPELSAYSGFNGPPIPQAAAPVFRQQYIQGPVLISRADGPVFNREFGQSYFAYDSSTRLPVIYILGAPMGYQYHGLALVELACGPADLNSDGVLDLLDASLFSTLFQSQNPTADLNGDGLFDLSDVTDFIDLFTAGCVN